MIQKKQWKQLLGGTRFSRNFHSWNESKSIPLNSGPSFFERHIPGQTMKDMTNRVLSFTIDVSILCNSDDLPFATRLITPWDVYVSFCGV